MGSAGGPVATDVANRAPLLGKNTIFAAPQKALAWQVVRALMYRLRDATRRITESSRAKGCGYRLIQARVSVSGIQTDRGLRAHYDGILRCGLVWICSVCSLQIRAERAGEIRLALEQHGATRVYMLTLTIRHANAHALRELVGALMAAHRKLSKNAPWRKQKRHYGIIGTIRGFEITHGASGWHPHLHILLFLENPLGSGERDALETWLQSHWAQYVATTSTEATTPNDFHGARLTPCHDGSYVSKMHLEITAPRGKKTKGHNRTPWDILHDFDVYGSERDALLLREHELATRGLNFVRWSTGLKARFKIGEQSDDQIVEGGAQEETVLAMLGSDAWRAVRRTSGAVVRLLEAAEAGGFNAVRDLMRELAPDVCVEPPGAVAPQHWEEGEHGLWEDIARGRSVP